MTRLNRYVFSIVVLTYFSGSISLAQSQTQPQQAPKPAETATMKMEDVSKWTQKQWNAAKAKWSEEKTKWNDCQTQAKVKSLSGHKSWQFLYDCMTM
jgi:phage shock protein A